LPQIKNCLDVFTLAVDAVLSSEVNPIYAYHSSVVNIPEMLLSSHKCQNSSKEMSMLIFWIVIPCGLVGRCGATYCLLHLHGTSTLMMRQYVPPKRPRGVTTQKTNAGVFTALGTSNLIRPKKCFFSSVLSVPKHNMTTDNVIL
jgi:hypothetical protein